MLSVLEVYFTYFMGVEDPSPEFGLYEDGDGGLAKKRSEETGEMFKFGPLV